MRRTTQDNKYGGARGGGGAGAQKLVTCGTQGLIGRYQIMPFSAHMAPTDLSSSMRELRIMNYGII